MDRRQSPRSSLAISTLRSHGSPPVDIHPTDEAITDTGVARFTTFTDPDGNELQLIER